MSDKFSLEQLMKCSNIIENIAYITAHKNEPELLAEYERIMEKISYIQEHENDPDLELLTDVEKWILVKFLHAGFPPPIGEFLDKNTWPKRKMNFSQWGSHDQMMENYKELGTISWRAQFMEFLKANGIESPV